MLVAAVEQPTAADAFVELGSIQKRGAPKRHVAAVAHAAETREHEPAGRIKIEHRRRTNVLPHCLASGHATRILDGLHVAHFAADRCRVRRDQGRHQRVQPPGLDDRIIVDVGDQFAARSS
jgi:hypothetical protein